MNPFVGREADFARLSDHLTEVVNTGQGRLLTVRGRRQVGKSVLLTRFVARATTASLYVTAVKNAPPAAHLADLAEAAATSPHPPRDADLLREPPESWADALRSVSLMARREPLILVIDEYPWAAAADPELDGRLQVAWDRTLEQAPVLLILVGSDLAVMERTTAHDSPLYGRARPMVVQPLTPRDAAAALGTSDPVAAIDCHLVTGGYPRLLRAAVVAGGAGPVVRASTADALSELVVTAQLTLDAELPPTVAARAVLEAIGDDSRGPAVFGAITDRLAGDRGTVRAQVSRSMGVLQDKGLVEVDVPVGAGPTSRLRRYRVADPYLRFWLRFLAPRLGDIERGRGDLAWQAFERGWSSWRGRAVEPLVRAALWRAAPDVADLTGTEVVGGWWDRAGSVEVDVVLAGRGETLGAGTIKWRERSPVSRNEVRELERAAAHLGLSGKRPRIVVCPAGASPDSGADLVWTAEDVLTWS